MKRFPLTVHIPFCMALLAAAMLAASLAAVPATAAPYPAEVAAWDAQTKQKQRDAGAQLLRDIAAAAAAGKRAFSVPAGHYRFAATEKQGSRQVFIRLMKLSDFVIEGNGSTFWFEDDHQAFYLGGCRNVTIRNLELDWDPLPFTQGVIVGADPTTRTLEVRIDPGYERVTPHFASIPPDQHQPNVRGAVFDAAGRFKRQQNGFRVMPFLQNRRENGAYPVKVLPFYERDLASINAAVGDRIAFWIRGEGAFLIETSENVTLEDITLNSCAGFAFRDAAGKGPVTYRRCRIVPRPGTDRLLGGNSDGFHSANMEIGHRVENCEVRSIGDDGVNVHGFFYAVLAQESPTVLITEPIAWRGDLANVTLDFYRKGEYAPLGRRTGITVKPLRWNGRDARRVELDAPLTAAPGDIFSCDNYVGAGAVIRDSTFTNILPRGVLYRSHHGVIENNRFEWIGSAALGLYAQPDFWKESAYIHDLVVRGNTITDSNVLADGTRPGSVAGITLQAPGFAAGARQRNVDIVDNVVVRPGGHGIRVEGAEGLRITGNRIREYGDSLPGYGIFLEAVKDVVLERNTLSEPGKKAQGELRPDGGIAP